MGGCCWRQSLLTFKPNVRAMLRGFLASPCTRSPQTSVSPLTSLQNLVDQYRTSQSRLKPAERPTSLHSSVSEGYEVLVHQCRGSCSSEDAKRLHLHVCKNGFAGDVFSSNTLINAYFRTGDITSARKLFDDMPCRNSVSWSCIISGYTQNAVPDEARSAFREMISMGFLPTHFAVGSALRACQELGPLGLECGTQIHGLISKTWHPSDASICNALISMYGGCSMCSADACRAFEAIENKDLISWNSIVSVYAQRGDAVSCFELFSDMQQGHSVRPNEYTFGSLISASCSSAESGNILLQQMLTRVLKSGSLQDLYVGSALVSGCARFGLVDNARMILKQMYEKNAVSMNGLMVGLVRQKRGEEAVQVFVELKDVQFNIDSYVVLLSALPEFALLEEGMRIGREVHAYVIRNGLDNANVAIQNGLVNMYAKCGAIDDACSVFRLIAHKDSVSWNTMISGLDQNECFEDAVINFCRMRRTGLKPSNFTLISTLSSCASLGCTMLGLQIHSEVIKLGLNMDVSVSNALLAMYAETRCLVAVKNVFSLMPEHDKVSWNTIIGAFADSESLVFEALKYFFEMMRAGWVLNRISFMNVLSAVSSLSLHEVGLQIHALVLKYGASKDSAIENALLSCYGKCQGMVDCEKLFSRMYGRRDEISWNSMISGYIHNEQLNKAMDLVWFMMQQGQKLDCFTFATVLSACASVATLQRGMEVHACEVRACLESDVVVGSALVDMYSKCGRIDYASRFFEMMPIKNVYSWNSMISGYARHGHGKEGLQLFKKMQLEGPPPDQVTFVGVLSACSHVGLVEEGFEHFELMSKIYGLAPRMEHFSCVVDLLGRCGELHKLEDFINRMPVKPNALIWRTVLGACCRAGGHYIDLGRRAAETLLEFEPQNATNYVLLGNMYASGGQWEDVAKARTLMRAAAVKKEAGCSWVTMKDGVHVFVAGDTSHPENKLIYEKLNELHQKIREAGYVPQTKFALYDLDQETKEELLSYHSEKLAVAFVLTRESTMTIRIMKNLRVCGDCHSAFQYISKVLSRQIVLRDSNRFHHFSDGECSCGNYW